MYNFLLFKATRKMLGNGNVIRRIAERTTNEVKADLTHVNVGDDDDDDYDFYPPRICFDPNHYTVMENCGTVDIRIVRLGDFSSHVSVDYMTMDGSAEVSLTYIFCSCYFFSPQIANEKKTFIFQIIQMNKKNLIRGWF